ncbi:MAG: DNA cytosine methyltransferase [Clostridiales bacterium]|nr:DNA cytosine methyltransferase [Clostridiales bacterium]
MLNVATVCSGIGAPEKALHNLQIPYKLIFFSEIDKPAIKSYCAIHNESESKNIGDLKNFHNHKFNEQIDLLIGGTPCQDFSTAGQGAGGEQNSGTRSSLMWNYLAMIEALKPKVVIWENVPAVIHSKHYQNYKKFYFKLMSLGYCIDAHIHNAKYFNVPQNRERMFLVAQRKDCIIPFEHPVGYDSGIRLKDIMDDLPSNKRLPRFKPIIDDKHSTHRIIKCGASIDNSYKNGNLLISANGISDCLTTHDSNWILFNDTMRKLTAKERFLAMGFEVEDYEACINAKVSTGAMIAQTGNSIVVTVLMAIFGQLYKVDWKRKVYKDRYKTQNQLLAELPIFQRINNEDK